MSSSPFEFPPHFHVELDAIQELVDLPKPPKGKADYSRAAFQLYCVLCSFAYGSYGTTNEVWPGYVKLKKRTGFSKTTINRATALLIRLKLIKTLRQGTRHPSITYILLLRPVIPEWAKKKSEEVASTPPGGSVHASKGGSVHASKGVASTPPEERDNEELHPEENNKRRTADAGSIDTSSGVQEGEIDTTQVNDAGGDNGALDLNGMAPYCFELYGSFHEFMSQLKAHQKREAQPDQ